MRGIGIDITVNYDDVRQLANEGDIDLSHDDIEAVTEGLTQREVYLAAVLAVERLIVKKLKAKFKESA